jgi:PAS domain S-box-containing protein
MDAFAFLRRIMNTDAGLLRLARARPVSPWRSALIGVFWAVAVLLVRASLAAFYKDVTGFMILLPGVVLAALSAGRIAGMTSVIACLGGGWLLVHVTGLGANGGSARLNAIATVNFVIVGLFASVVAASLRKTVRRLDAAVVAQQAADARIGETEIELRAMVDQASAGIARVALDGVIERVNARFAEILGTTQDRLVGRATVDMTHPDDVAPTTALLASALEGGAGQVEKRYFRGDGSVVWALTSLQRLLDPQGNPRGFIAVIVDISEAKATEAALRESEERFRLMADTAPSPVWLTNEEGDVEFVNKALVDFYGRPARELMGQMWKMTIHPDDQPAVAASQAAARPLHLPYDFECRFRRSDGAWRWSNVSVNPRFDGQGLFRGYVGMAFDVTEARTALDTLARQERRQTFLLSLTDRLRELSDPEAVMSEVSRSLGLALKAARVGFGELDAVAGTYRLYPDWTNGVASTAGVWNVDDFGGEVDLELLQGLLVVVEDTAADPRTAPTIDAFRGMGVGAFAAAPLMRAGQLRAFLSVNDAVARVWTADELGLLDEVAERAWVEVERTRAQAEVAESEARFRAVADTAPVLIWVTQEDGTRAFVNQAYVAFMGGDYESARLANWRNFIHPEDQDRMVTESLAGETTGQPFSLEARYLNNSGAYRRLKSFSRPRFGATGEMIGFVGVAFDVTDAKQAEDDLKRINELLEERVAEALAEKAKAEANLMHAQRMEAVGRLTGGVAHDFNNLLTVVICALDMMLRSPDDAARRKKLGEAALAAARRGEGLTHQLLAFSRRQALRPQAVDLNALIREGEPLLKRAVGETIDFRLKLRRGAVGVNVDAAQFEAALLNLLVNARDAVVARTGRGGPARGRITLQTSHCWVEAGEAPDLEAGDYVCVIVSDNGAGMDEATLVRVFEPFFTTKAVGKGTGLGLSQVYGFARQSGGAAKVTSTLGRGTTIHLYLPRLDSAAFATSEQDKTGSGAIPGGHRLLLVEDDVNVAAIAVELLTGLGLDVQAVETAPQALQILSEGHFDIMLSDVVMPGGMTGIELARICAQRYPDLPILLTSGYAGDDVDEALADAPWPFLRKPYSGEQLREALADLLPITSPPT